MVVRNTKRRRPWQDCLLISAFCLLFIACVPSTRPSIKIGLVGPFEGRYREIGEEVIYAVRLAVREANQSGGIGGYTVELVAYDDGGDPDQAAEQAHKMVTDPQVVGVMGNWLESTTEAAAPVYADSGIALISMGATGELGPTSFRLWYTASEYLDANPESDHCPLPCDNLEDLTWLDSALAKHPEPRRGEWANTQYSVLSGPAMWGLTQFPRLAGEAADGIAIVTPSPLPRDSTDPSFAERYDSVSPAPQSRYLAVLAYDATQILLAAIDEDIRQNELATRSGVLTALDQIDHNGLSGHIGFDSNREWVEAKGWVYHWQDGALK